MHYVIKKTREKNLIKISLTRYSVRQVFKCKDLCTDRPDVGDGPGVAAAAAVEAWYGRL